MSSLSPRVKVNGSPCSHATSPVPQGCDKLFKELGDVEYLVEAYATVALQDREVLTETLCALVCVSNIDINWHFFHCHHH